MYETQTELTEAREELELTKLKLDVAEQEAEAAKRQAAEAAAALLQAQDSPGLLSPAHRRSLSREVETFSHSASPQHCSPITCCLLPSNLEQSCLSLLFCMA